MLMISEINHNLFFQTSSRLGKLPEGVTLMLNRPFTGLDFLNAFVIHILEMKEAGITQTHNDTAQVLYVMFPDQFDTG